LLLQDQAAAVGGQVINLLGNHELMLMQGDTRYATARDQDAYGGHQEFLRQWTSTGEQTFGGRVRRRARVAAVVADVLYVHAGLQPKILDKFASGIEGQEAVPRLNDQALNLLLAGERELQASRSAMLHEDGPFWTRKLSLEPESVACPLVEQTLDRLGLRRMVVGHTPQQSGDVGLRCKGRLVLADTFLSQAYTGDAASSAHNEAAVEFYDDSTDMSVVYAKRPGATCKALKLEASVAPFPPSLRKPAGPARSPADVAAAAGGGGGAAAPGGARAEGALADQGAAPRGGRGPAGAQAGKAQIAKLGGHASEGAALAFHDVEGHSTALGIFGAAFLTLVALIALCQIMCARKAQASAGSRKGAD